MKEQKYPRLFQWKEKHGDYFILVNSKEEYSKMWLKVLKERNDAGWYSWMENYVPYGFKELSYKKEDVDALPDSMKDEKEKMYRLLKEQSRSLNEQIETRQLYKYISLALSTQHAATAYAVLNELNDGEYEGYEEIYYDTIN